MDELFDIPFEFLEPLRLCFNTLEKCNVVIFDKEKSFWKTYWRSFYIIPCVVAYYSSLAVYLRNIFKGELDRVTLAYVVSIFMVCTQALLKAFIVISNKEELRTLIVQLGSIWQTTDLTEVQINKKNALLKKLKFCNAVFYWMTISGSWQYILAPLLETVFRKYILQQECGLLLPFSCSFPFDPTGNWFRYIGVYIFEAYSMFRIAFYYIGGELMVVTLSSHISTQFTILSDALLNYKPKSEYEDVKPIIERHQKLIGVADQLDTIFTKMIFMNLTSASISICFFALSAKVANSILDIARNFGAVIALIIPIYVICHYSEDLRQSSSSVGDSAYHHSWYQYNKKHQVMMLIVIMRSQKLCSLSSLKHVPIGLNTFTAVLSTTWSYFSLASTLYDGQS